jgi:hypothetical protein
MLGDRRPADRQLARELADRLRPLGDPLEDLAPRRVPQRRDAINSVSHRLR